MRINKKQIAYNRTSRNQKPVYIVIHDTGNTGKAPMQMHTLTILTAVTETHRQTSLLTIRRFFK